MARRSTREAEARVTRADLAVFALMRRSTKVSHTVFHRRKTSLADEKRASPWRDEDSGVEKSRLWLPWCVSWQMEETAGGRYHSESELLHAGPSSKPACRGLGEGRVEGELENETSVRPCPLPPPSHPSPRSPTPSPFPPLTFRHPLIMSDEENDANESVQQPAPACRDSLPLPVELAS